jgi:regulator of replication initiation timing
VQAVAKLSADNVVLMVKLGRAEKRLALLSHECQELQAAVQDQSGGWFDDVKNVVEQRVSTSLQRADQLEAQLQTMTEQNSEERQALQIKHDDLTERLATSMRTCSQLEGEVADARCVLSSHVVRAESAENVGSTSASNHTSNSTPLSEIQGGP